ncbi:Dihydrofolate synthase [Shewanella sediminis HAW-EB3]|uniref:Dihydrofolate synthase/folylpolyglutamate synthase n=1 Tax=Shewanella sediminis (strain HAW-EB3) TaxID=425104 RepID=A8FTU1_SHESH|nr:bifunctional tetrahydrofolate synthase/dihydrofolate synthase [Shewanella sediminis]ABV36264.1 Dihydrofolate synthase [Shewanella sediminis HAW-EB3]
MPKAPVKDTSLDNWLDYLLAIHPTEIEMGLTRVSEVAERLELRELPGIQVVTVAGTNGKGTTCAFIEQILLASGLSVGVYSSPHMLNYNERVRINGEDVADSFLIEAFEAINRARNEISLSFFEFATLAGLYIFKAVAPDVILLEVGLGGRLDATNIIDADICVVTSIDIDHQEYLGDTRDLVGREKAGIFRNSKPAIVGEPNMPDSIFDVAQEVGANIYQVNQAFTYQADAGSQAWKFNGQRLTLDNIPLPQLPLPNAATALAVIEHGWPELSADVIKKAIGEARLGGRLETVSQAPLVLLDVAHNPHAARYLASRLEAYKPKRVFALCGMLKDKDCTEVIQTLAPLVDHWSFTRLRTERSASADTLRGALTTQCDAHTYKSVDLAWQAISSEIHDEDMVIVFGSFYTVAEFKGLQIGTV